MILSRSISLFLYKITMEITLDFLFFRVYNQGVENIIGGAERLRWHARAELRNLMRVIPP